MPVSGGVSDQRHAAYVGDSHERERPADRSHPRTTLSAFRVPPTNSLTLTLTRPASRDPRAGPLGRHVIPRHALFRVKGPLNAYGG